MSTPSKRLVKRVAPATSDNGAVPVKKATKKMAAAPARPAPVQPEYEPEAAPVKSAVKKAAPPASREVPEEDQELRPGWTAAQQTMDSTSSWVPTFKPTTGTQIVKFLEAAPYASYKRHWIDRVGAGNRPFTCLESYGRPCPLCEVAVRASSVSAFNIAVCGDDGEGILMPWECGARVTRTLKTFAADPKIVGSGPGSGLHRPGLYFAVSKTEAATRQQGGDTLVSPVRERDLQEDYGVPPLTEAKLARLMLKLHTNEIVPKPSTSELQEIADEIMNEDTGSAGSGWGNS